MQIIGLATIVSRPSELRWPKHPRMKIPDRLRRGGAEACWVALGQGLGLIGAFAAIKMLTDQLGPAEYGRLALGLSAAGILHMFIYGPVEQTALRYLSIFRERQELGLLFHFLRKAHLLLFFSIACVAFSVGFLNMLFGESRWGILIATAAILGIFSGINSTLSSLQTAMRQRRPVAIFQAGDVWLRLGLALLAMAALGISADSALVGFSLASIIIMVAQASFLHQQPDLLPSLKSTNFSQEIRQKRRAELFAYGLPYVIFAGFAWLGAYADRWLLMVFEDTHTVGIYAAMIQIANAPVALFIGMTNQYLVPIIFDRAGGGSSAQVASSARLLAYAIAAYSIVLSLIVLSMALFAEPLVLLLTNPAFSYHSGVLWILSAALGVASMAQLLVLRGLSQSRSRQYILPKFIQVLALFATGLVMVPNLGLAGMCFALVASSLCYLGAVLFVNRQSAA